VEPTPNQPARRLTDATSPATLIAAGTTVHGDVSGRDALEVRGTVEGDCRVAGLCTVAAGGRVLGNIEAQGLVVAGEIEAGKLTVDRVELRSTARVRAAITARALAIADGAFYEGDVLLEPGCDAGPTFFKDRRQG
jgi:cytoskeletal protein CcmA (bactofilin family)